MPYRRALRPPRSTARSPGARRDRRAPACKLRESGARRERARGAVLALPGALLVTLLVTLLAACQGESPVTGALRTLPRPDASGRLLVADAGFAAPAAALYDSAADVYLVANTGHDPAVGSDDGFISRVGPDGRVLDLKWIQGSKTSPLHGPTGLALKGDTLLVADVGAVRMYDRTTGNPLESRVVSGVVLDGVAVGPDGTVYASAGGPARAAAIYQVGRYGVYPIAHGAALGRPAGLVADARGIVVAPADGRTLYRLDVRARGRPAGRPAPLATLPQPLLDGLLRLPGGDLVATSWAGRAVYRVHPNGSVETAIDGIDAPAQPGLDTRRDRLLVPLLRQQALLVAPLRR